MKLKKWASSSEISDKNLKCTMLGKDASRFELNDTILERDLKCNSQVNYTVFITQTEYYSIKQTTRCYHLI